MKDDNISRREAIDALESGKDKRAKGDIGGFYNAIIQNDIDKLRNLPSAKPEILACGEGELNVPDANVGDMVSRQAVKDWLLKWEGYIDKDTIARMQYRTIDIPSAQSDAPTNTPTNTPTDYNSKLIDADALEREGWSLCRTFQEDKDTMVYEVKKPSDFPTIKERTGKWIPKGCNCFGCNQCGEVIMVNAYTAQKASDRFKFCPGRGAKMEVSNGRVV